MRDSQKTYTADGLIVVPRNVFISPEEAIKNPSLLETTLSKMNGLGDIQRKDEELWNYFTHNERFFKENYDEGSSLATAFVTGGLFTYSLLEMTNEPKPLPKMICFLNLLQIFSYLFITLFLSIFIKQKAFHIYDKY